MAGPQLIGGGGRMGRMTRDEMNGNYNRRFAKTTMPRGVLLRRFWKYLGRNRSLVLLAL